MADIPPRQIDIEALRAEIRGPVRTFANKLLQDLGENLESLAVVGSALTEDFSPKRSDINTVLLVGTRSSRLLRTLARYGKSMGKQRLRAPLLMTSQYIRQSLDVFGIEFLDFQLNHAMVYGQDPFDGLTFRKQDVRLQCERELKGALIQLRQGYIQSLGTAKAVGELLTACTGQLLVLLRAMLWLVDAQRPRLARPTIDAAAEKFEFDSGSLVSLATLKQQGTLPQAGQIEPMFESIYQTIDHLSRQVDQLRTT